jgi:hypothetical protein
VQVAGLPIMRIDGGSFVKCFEYLLLMQNCRLPALALARSAHFRSTGAPPVKRAFPRARENLLFRLMQDLDAREKTQFAKEVSCTCSKYVMEI